MTCQRDIGRSAAWAVVCAAIVHAAAQAAPGATAAPAASATAASASPPAMAQAGRGAPGATAGSAPPPIQAGPVLAHVRQTVDWYQRTQGIETLPDLAQDPVAHDRLRQASPSVVQQAFAFGQAATTLLESTAQGGTRAMGAGGRQAALNDAITRAAARATALQEQLKEIDSQLERAGPAARAKLLAQRGDVNAALDLEHEVQSAIEELQRFETSTLVVRAEGTGDLQAQIEDLERSVPEVRPSPSGAGSGPGNQPVGGATSPRPSSATSGAASAATFRPESAGVIALIGEWFSLESASRQVRSALSATDALAKELNALRAPLLSQVRGLVGMEMTGLDATSIAELQNTRLALQNATSRFKQLASLLIPLGEQQFVLEDAEGALRQWRGSIDSRRGTIERYLLMHLAVLGALIALVLIVSEIARRATFRYLHDARRLSQFQTLRRVAVGIALVTVITFGLVTQLGSLATYAGFLTAGLAVALQNVILSIVAYFFLIGRYGVRTGDRITLAGVTGRVVDIGLIRLYLMELAGPDLHPTGRVVVLSNSVLFQPQALFKQIPGADIPWHAVAVTLATSVDLQEAQRRLKAAADAAYEPYREPMEQQHATVQRLAGFETSLPQPEVRTAFSETGLLFEVRYPVQGDHAVAIDQRMLKAVREALAQEPKLPVAPSGEPSLKRLDVT